MSERREGGREEWRGTLLYSLNIKFGIQWLLTRYT